MYFQAALTKALQAGLWPVWGMEPYRRRADDRGAGPRPRYVLRVVGRAKRRKSLRSPHRGRAVNRPIPRKPGKIGTPSRNRRRAAVCSIGGSPSRSGAGRKSIGAQWPRRTSSSLACARVPPLSPVPNRCVQGGPLWSTGPRDRSQASARTWGRGHASTRSARWRTRWRADSQEESGTKHSVRRGAANYSAHRFASRRSVWIRSPVRRGLEPGAMTGHATPRSGNDRDHP